MKPIARATQFLFFWIALVVVLYYGKVLLIPFTFAAILAMLMAPVCRKFDSLGFHRAISSLICVLILLVVFAFMLFIVLAQVNSFLQDIPLVEQKLNAMISSLHNFLEKSFNIPVEKQKEFVQNQIRNFTQSSSSYIGSIVTSAASIIVNAIFILVISFLLLFGKEKYYNFFLKLMHSTHDDVKTSMLNRITLVSQKYLVGRALSMLALFILYFIALLIIGVKNALLLSLVAALVNIIPYVGPILAGVFPFLAALVTQESFEPAIWVVISFSIIQGIDNYFVTPFVMGGEVNLNALTTILSIICGGFLWGIAGMILFIPLLSIAKIVFDHVESLKPYGYLIGDDTEHPPSLRMINWIKNKFNFSSKKP
jgi:predicted PurR-regulated permease PerM